MITLEQAREAMEKGQYVLWVIPSYIGYAITWEEIRSIELLPTMALVHFKRGASSILENLYLQLDAGALHETLCEVRDRLIQHERENDGKDKA